MIDGKSVLAVIPARGGSKGIKDKNIIDLCGKPLIAYSVIAGRESAYIDSVVVTTDSDRIAKAALEYGAEVPFKRPDELASDTARSLDVILHAVRWLKERGRIYDIVVLLQPTQPLRTAADIDGALEKYMSEGMRPLISVTEAEESPVLMRTVNENGLLEKVLDMDCSLRRQDMRAYYIIDGSIYINAAAELDEDTNFGDNPVPYFMPRERSVDIDEYKDLEKAAEYLLKTSKEYDNILKEYKI